VKLKNLIPIIIFVIHGQANSSSLLEQAQQFYDLEKFDQAIITADKALTKTQIDEQAPIFFILGRSQSAMGFYDSALVSFELASDLSNDPVLDREIDDEIEITIRKQQAFESNKLKNRFALSVGMGYDSNVLNVNPDNYQGVDLASISAIYGFTFSRKALANEKESLIPEFNFQDNYSLNSSLKTDSTIQSNDALIWSFTVPYIQFRKIVNPNDYVKYQLQYQNVYLPSTDKKRSLAYVSAGFTTEYLLNFSNWYVLVPSFSIFSDSSQLSVTDSVNNTTATRLNFRFLNLFNLSNQGNKRATFRIEYTNNNAGGENAFYNRFLAGAGYNFDWDYDILINTELKYQITNYSKTESSRDDNMTGLDLELTKQLNELTRLGAVISTQVSNSSSDANKYNDTSVSVFYNRAFEF
jgi:tetratricopeptide (TPR) repeat protein